MPASFRTGLALGLALLAAPLLAFGDGKPVIGTYGFDVTGMDPSVRPGEDFNRYANGTWAQRTVIPGDHAYWGTWDILEEQSRAHVREILDEAARAKAPPGSNARKMGDYYASFMDEAAIERLGAGPLQPQLAAIATIRDYAALAAAFGHALRDGAAVPFNLAVFSDLKNPDLSVGYLEQGGLCLPDRDYYLQDEPAMAKARDAYRAYAAKLLRLAGLARGEAEARARATAVFELERGLAEVQWTRVAMRNIPARYDVWKLGEYPLRAPGFDWSAFFRAAGVGDQPVLVASTNTAITATAALIPKTPLATWRDYLALRTIDAHAPFLAKRFVDAHFAFHATELAGTPDQQERWKRGARYTEAALGEAIGEIYVSRHFGADAKAAARRLVANLVVATDQRLDASDWMSAETKRRAHEKVASLVTKIGYPDRWRDYSKLSVTRGAAYANAIAADRFAYDRQLAKIGKPVDRSEWDMTPMTVNAYYNPTQNEIVFPAAVLQPPFFDAKADAAVNYGGIGAIIGHEISHGFDDQGRLFDAKGALSDWWTAADAENYKRRTDALVAQYSAYEVLPGLKLNGELTLGENIADTAGIVLAYHAYRNSLGAATAPVIDGTTGDQRFYLGYAQNWRTLSREASLRQQTTTDPHSPDAIRVRTVRNSDPWYAAYDVGTSDALYLAPDRRVRIW